MIPVKTASSNMVYKGPRPEIGDLPCERVRPGLIRSVWRLSETERAHIAAGGLVELEIFMEPIPPVALNCSAEVALPADVLTVEQAAAALQRLGKWRAHFAGWVFGTRLKDDPQCEWARDTAEKLLLLRAEVSPLTRLLVDARVFDQEPFSIQLGQEAVALSNMIEERWPGITATDSGLNYDLHGIQQAGWMKRWLP